VADHAWNEITEDGACIAYTCGRCGKTIPGLIVFVAPGTAQQLRDSNRVPSGTELVESAFLPDPQTGYAFDPRVTEETVCVVAPSAVGG
jgi:hypothetical protein